MNLLPFMVSRGTPVYSTIFHGVLSSAFDVKTDIAGTKITWRTVINPPGDFPKGGTKLRLVLSADLTGWANDVGTAIDHVSVGVSAGNGNTVATPVMATWQGNAFWHTQAPFIAMQSDEISLSFQKTDGLVVIIDTAANVRAGIAGGGPAFNPGCSVYYKGGVASYNLATISGYQLLPIGSPALPQGIIGVLNIGAK